mgnify:CR=1 FL=1
MMNLERTIWISWASIALQAVFAFMMFHSDQMPMQSDRLLLAAYANFLAFIFLWIRRYDLAGGFTWL